MTQITIDKAVLEQLVGVLKQIQALTDGRDVYLGSPPTESKERKILNLVSECRTAIANAEPEEPKLWLWKNFVDGRQEYWAFDNLYPINMNDGDPQTLGEPCGYALFKPSRNGRKDTL